MKHSDIVPLETVVINRLRNSLCVSVDPRLQIEVIADALIARLTFYLDNLGLDEHVLSVSYPDGWVQALKEKLGMKFRYKTITKTVEKFNVCPHGLTDGREMHLTWLTGLQ